MWRGELAEGDPTLGQLEDLLDVLLDSLSGGR